MSKYGFNENEVRKTIITKIDKDGFHKEETFDGNVDGGSSDFTFATMTIEENSSDITMSTPICMETNDSGPARLETSSHLFEAGTAVNIPLYKGYARCGIEISPTGSFVIDGDAEVDMVNYTIDIYGDFTISYNSGK